jgi:hypothetical protein
MAQFSGTVKIGDLNDFIAPSQSCVVSVQGGAALPNSVKAPQQLTLEVRPAAAARRGPRPLFRFGRRRPAALLFLP